MISIIISSFNRDFFSKLQKNIAKTCGVSYEIIKVDNPGLMGICEAYNLGAAQAKYDNLIFVHEDVEFRTENWGRLLLEKYFSLPKVGLLGLAGDVRKFGLPYGYHSAIPGCSYMFLNQKGEKETIYKKVEFPLKIKVVDGVFIAMKKEVWEKIPFNNNIKGFHFYDVDLSMRTSAAFQNYLITDVDFVHFSTGNFGNDWVEACLKHWKGYHNFDPISPKERRDVRNFWYQYLSHSNITITNRLRYALALGNNKDTIMNCLKFIFSLK